MRIIAFALAVALAVTLTAYVIYSYTHSNQKHDDCHVLEKRTLSDGTVLEIVNDACKEGMPHTTTKETVRMTRGVLNSSKYDEIMTHERVHLDQKTRPAFWRSLVSRIWSYELYKTAPAGVPAEQIRPNPDTDAAPWAVWRGRYVFFAAFGDDKTLKSAPVRIWDLEERRFTEIPPEWRKQFCGDTDCPHQYEHPYELAAEYITHTSQAPAAAALSAALS